MTASVGYPTLRLVRVRIENLYLKNMKLGEVLELQGIMLSEFYKMINKKAASHFKSNTKQR